MVGRAEVEYTDAMLSISTRTTTPEGLLQFSDIDVPNEFDGTSGGVVRGPAGGPLQFGDVVIWGDDGFVLATPVDGRTSGLCITEAAQVGESITALTAGNAESADWSATTGSVLLEPGRTYYLQLNGKLGIIPYSDGFMVRVGRAASPNVLCVTFDLKVK